MAAECFTKFLGGQQMITVNARAKVEDLRQLKKVELVTELAE